MPENSNSGKEARVTVARHEVVLPADVARRVCRAWERMLRGVRPVANDPGFVRIDGETIEFRRHDLRGETWSPDGGDLEHLVDLGRSLR